MQTNIIAIRQSNMQVSLVVTCDFGIPPFRMLAITTNDQSSPIELLDYILGRTVPTSLPEDFFKPNEGPKTWIVISSAMVHYVDVGLLKS